MQLKFETNGNDKQKEVCRLWQDDEVTEIVYGGAKMGGKSFLGCNLIFSNALTYPDTFYFIARKQLIDLRKHTIPSIKEVFQIWGIDERYYKYNGSDNYFEFHNQSRVYLIDAKYLPNDPLYERFGSMQMTRGWIEEGGEFTAEAKANLQASIGRKNNEKYNLSPKLLITCNPKKNFLYSDYYKKHKDGILEPWKRFIQALPKDNKKAPKGYILNLERSLADSQKQRLLYGNWEYDDDPDLLVDYDAVCDIFTNDHVLETSDKSISADLAMKGRDRFVAGIWKGLVCRIAVDKPLSDGKSIEEDLRKLMTIEGVGRSRLVADSDGLGSYLASYLKGMKEFHNGARAINSDLYANLKSECAYKLAERINKREIRIVCTEQQKEIIKDELMVLKGDNIDSDTQKRKIISKEQMKETLGHSPDYFDMLIMGMWFELMRNSRRIGKPPKVTLTRLT